MKKVEPKLKPLVADLKETDMRYYLASTDFERDCIEWEIEDDWDEFYNAAVKKRTYLIADPKFDHKPFDCFEALTDLMNDAYANDKRYFFDVMSDILIGFLEWNKDLRNFDSLFKDLELLDWPHGDFEEIEIAHLDNQKRLKKQKSKTEKKETASHPIDKSGGKSIFQAKYFLDLISQAETERVIAELRVFLSESSNTTALLKISNLSARWFVVKDLKNSGIASFDDVNTEMNKINNSIIDLIGHLANSKF